MPVNVSRLRLWFAAAAVLLLALVAGFYVYGRMRARRALKELPRNLGINIQQSTEGFTFSKSEGGRTLFTVHASKAVQYKQTGRAELRDVNIIVYGQQANRFDQIYGADFEYDPQSGDISARGEVHIDLEGNAEGPIRPDQAPPQELKNPIHLKTSGLVFNQKTGVASTREAIEFRVPQASGSAVGATYDSKAATLTLHKDIRVRTGEPRPTNIAARQAVITRGPNRAILDQARVESATGGFSTRQLTVFFRDDNTVERVVASGDVQAAETGHTAMQASAARGEAWLSTRNQLRTVLLTGGVELNASGQQQAHASAGKMQLAFAGRSRLEKVTASDNVRLLQQPKGAGHPVELVASAMDFLVRDGHILTQATTSGPAQVSILPTDVARASEPAARAADAGQTTTVASAARFEARFHDNRLASLTGMPEARIVMSAPGQADKVSTSQRVDATFGPSGGLATLTQAGEFHYVENAPGGRREAWAQKAAFSQTTDALTLTGSPRIVEGGMTTTANSIRIDRRSGDASAAGDVKTTYSELKPQPGGALLASGEPIHVTGSSMVAQRSTGTATYHGARLWQGANVIEAPVIVFERDPRRVEARGENGRRITTVFVEQGKNGRVTPVNVTAARLVYTDARREARFEGGVTVRGADTTVTANQVDVYVQAPGTGNAAQQNATPSQVERIVARGNVVIQQPKRRATGQVLVYTGLEGKFSLTGETPCIFDAERGKICGDTLTFYQRDDKVLVESKTSPTVTQIRVAK
jgi:lipopolysaccharide export system protein LptA